MLQRVKKRSLLIKFMMVEKMNLCLMQGTLRKQVTIEGIGIYKREDTRITIFPATRNYGIRFMRQGSGKTIEALICNADYGGPDRRTTVLRKDDEEICCVEHLLAALYAMGITNARVEYEGAEVPMMDGSALAFAEAIISAGIAQQGEVEKAYVIKDYIVRRESPRYVAVDILSAHPGSRPDGHLHTAVTIDYPQKYIGKQSMELFFGSNSAEQFMKELARARTFCMDRDLNGLENGLFEKALEHMVVFDKLGAVNWGRLKYDNEPVRHKLVDMIGDLSLLGYPIIGDIAAFMPGHQLNHALARAIKAESEKNDGKVVMVNLQE